MWDDAEQALYFIDMVGKALHRYDRSDGGTQSLDVGQIVGSMALREQGGAIVSLKDGLYTLDLSSGVVELLAQSG